MKRRSLLLGTIGLGLSGCNGKSGRQLFSVSPKDPLDECPALKAYLKTMCKLPAGSFIMGTNLSPSASPPHKVTISEFQLGRTPVTVALWKEYALQTNGGIMPVEPIPVERGRYLEVSKNTFEGWLDENHPIVNISWDDCQNFLKWASKVSGITLTLPSEAQWEYACRGGRSGLKYPWGNNFDRTKLWCSDKSCGDCLFTAPVNRDKYIDRNHPFGLVDMVGNVSEWCQDWFDLDWYKSKRPKVHDPINLVWRPDYLHQRLDGTTVQGPLRCIRGGSWQFYNPELFTCYLRGGEVAQYANRSDVGFRISSG
jgi:formylglycine-generating enzyme required for sulfatase activity